VSGTEGNPSAKVVQAPETTARTIEERLTKPTSPAPIETTKNTAPTPTTTEASTTPPTEATDAPRPIGKLLSKAYPVICNRDRSGDATYDEGDILAGKVALQGDGLLFSWTTAKAPKLLPGDYINYFAKYRVEEPYISSNFNIFMINTLDGKLEAQAFITDPDNYLREFSSEIKVIEEGKTLTVWLPGPYIWPLIGRGEQGQLLDNGLLTAGKWELVSNRDTSTLGARSGSDDYCGADDTDRVPQAR
jgi:hypothetical protein